MTLSRLLRRFAALSIAVVAVAALAQGPTPAPTQPRAPAARTTPASAPRTSPDRSVLLDRVVAIVNDEAVTQFDIDDQKRTILAQMRTQNVTPPAADVLEKQLLDRIITEHAILQFAKENGVRVDDTQVERAILRIAQDNKMSADEFRQALKKENIEYEKYREDIRKEIVIQRLREREVDSHVVVSDSEVDAFLASQNSQAGGDAEYRVSHILVLVPEKASPEQIDAKRRRAEEALKQVKDGTDFAQVAAGFSDAPDALQGGALGWRTAGRLPTVFVDSIRVMKPGDVSNVLRSATGFHIVKLQETRNRNAPTVVEQTRARHILIKVNEITSESEGKAKIERIRDRLETGAKFEDQAKLNSEDATSGKGGELGWISPGDTVPEFEATMNKLKIGEISLPVRTQFGWHIIQVQERRTQDITAERKRDQARMALRQRKSDEAFQDWLRQMRDRAYVEIKPLDQ
jgi:peptidyl-prolyl cis-trans isomerase SurA